MKQADPIATTEKRMLLLARLGLVPAQTPLREKERPDVKRDDLIGSDLPDFGVRMLVWSWASAVIDVTHHIRRGDWAWARRSQEHAARCFQLSLDAAETFVPKGTD